MKKLVLIVISFLLGTSYLYAGSNDAASQLKAFTSRTQNLQADFSQSLLQNTIATDTQPKTGVFYLSRPGLFRWNYHKPFLQEIVSNGKKVWFYDVDLEQVSVKTITKALSMGPALLLSGESSIADRFNLEQLPVTEGVAWLKLLPKDKISGFKSIKVGLKGNLLIEMLMEDDFDQVTRIVFSNIDIDPQFKSELFDFKIPAGVDVIED
ncbi:MAG: outer membrane lipoprotein chaperone LolA [Methylococcales bacterium]